MDTLRNKKTEATVIKTIASAHVELTLSVCVSDLKCTDKRFNLLCRL